MKRSSGSVASILALVLTLPVAALVMASSAHDASDVSLQLLHGADVVNGPAARDAEGSVLNGVALAEGLRTLAARDGYATVGVMPGVAGILPWQANLFARGPDVDAPVHGVAVEIERPDGRLDHIGLIDTAAGSAFGGAAQPAIEAEVRKLEAQGINKIVLLDRMRNYVADPSLTGTLRGIDVVIQAETSDLLARAAADGPFNSLRDGDEPTGRYPLQARDADGDAVVVVTSGQGYRYVGNLMLSFDAAGRVIAVDARSGPVATTAEARAALAEKLGAPVEPPPAARQALAEKVGAPDLRSLLEHEIRNQSYPLRQRTRTEQAATRTDIAG